MHLVDGEVQFLDDVHHFATDIAGGANDGDAIAHDQNILRRGAGEKSGSAFGSFAGAKQPVFTKFLLQEA
ncbi:hypothetical protein D3C80_1211090 [compost metagenome]